MKRKGKKVKATTAECDVKETQRDGEIFASARVGVGGRAYERDAGRRDEGCRRGGVMS